MSGAPAGEAAAALERATAYAERRFGGGARVTPLSGDASTRRYYRLHLGPETRILAVYPDPFVVEESPFVAVHRLLEGWGVPVPSLLEVEGSQGVMLLGDLGDITLHERLREAAPGERQALYQTALQDLLAMQRRAAAAPHAAVCFQLAFDVEKLTWELAFFVEHFLAGWRKASLSAEERGALAAGFATLACEMASWPRVLCHRDYHSRNLMHHAGRLFWVDYQDARLGPVTYDLASLLRDSYVELPEEFVTARLEEVYRSLPEGEPWPVFLRRFELTSVQRNLKALGTFGYQAMARGNQAYLEYVPRTARYALRNLRRYPELAGLRRALAPYLEGCVQFR